MCRAPFRGAHGGGGGWEGPPPAGSQGKLKVVFCPQLTEALLRALQRDGHPAEEGSGGGKHDHREHKSKALLTQARWDRDVWARLVVLGLKKDRSTNRHDKV